MAELMFEKGFLKGRAIKVPEGRFLIVGRAKEAGLPLPDPQLSRRHCKITHAPDGIVMEDLGSRNGTYVNGKPITSVKLHHGDEIVFGDQTARYVNPQEMRDSSGEFESEEAEATREIPELEPGQAMLLNPPKIVRGADSRPPTHAPIPIASPHPVGMGPLAQSGGFLPSADEGGLDELDAQLPQIDQNMPLPPDLNESIDADLSAPLPDLPRNTISMEETMVRPNRGVETSKAPAPQSKIKQLMNSYKAEVMALSKENVKAVPKAKPATSLRPRNADGSDMVVPSAEDTNTPVELDPVEDAAGQTTPTEEAGPVRVKPLTLPTASGSRARSATGPGATGGTGGTAGAGATKPAGGADAQWENENKIEAFLEAADENLSPGAARATTTASGRDPVKAKTLAMPSELTRGAKAGQELRDLNDALFEEKLAEEPEIIGESQLPEEAAEAPRALRPDETGPIDASLVAGVNDEIVIDSSRIDRHREIADEIFRAAQASAPESEADEADVIEEVDEDFDLDSLEPVAAPTLDLVQLDRSENTAESATGIEVIDPEKEGETVQEAVSAEPPQRPATTMGRQITPMPSLPPILVEAGLETIGGHEIYSYSDGLFAGKDRVMRADEHNLLEPIRAKNEEYSKPGQ